MRLQEAILNLKKTKRNATFTPQSFVSDLFKIDDIRIDLDESSDFESYFLYQSIDYDEEVGIVVIYYKDNPVMIATKKYRKSDWSY